MQRSFYYWKSVFRLDTPERAVLRSLTVSNLYIKLFEVVPNQQTAAPATLIQFKNSFPAGINCIPVVFIANDVFKRLDSLKFDSFAQHVSELAEQICTNNHFRGISEIQIDCDWTASDKENYFYFLKRLHRQPFLNKKLLSVTIRLHQLKYKSLTGIPPVDKGLLMCYNMGDLRDPKTNNSIIEVAEAKKYITHLKDYPLHLDVALPIFDWYVWFRKNRFKGLIHTEDITGGEYPPEKNLSFNKDTIWKGFTFAEGDCLRYEDSKVDVVVKMAKLLNDNIDIENLNVVLYHLDATEIHKYSIHDMETIYCCFH